MRTVQTIACLIANAPLDLPLIRATSRETVEEQNTNKIPGWDDWLDDNSVNARIANGDTGRLRARAWGVSNPFTNFRCIVGADFFFEFDLHPSRVALPGDRYRFTADITSEGRFLHLAAVPRPGDGRLPPASTISQLVRDITAFQILPSGDFQSIAAGPRINDLFRTVDATQALEELIDSTVQVSLDFFPNGLNPVVFRILRGVYGAATGVFSDIRITGSEGRRNFRVRVRNARVQRVLERNDPCFDILNR